MTVTLSDLCRGLAETIRTVEHCSDAGVELWHDPHGGIDLSSDRMRQLFHAVRLVRPGYFRLAMEACQFSVRRVLWDKDIRLNGHLCRICDEFPLKAVRIGWLSKPRLDLECALSGLRRGLNLCASGLLA